MYTVVQWSRSSLAVESLSLMRFLSSATHTKALEQGIVFYKGVPMCFLYRLSIKYIHVINFKSQNYIILFCFVHCFSHVVCTQISYNEKLVTVQVSQPYTRLVTENTTKPCEMTKLRIM